MRFGRRYDPLSFAVAMVIATVMMAMPDRKPAKVESRAFATAPAPASAPAAPGSYDARHGYHPPAAEAEPALPYDGLPVLVAAGVGAGILAFGVLGAWWMWPRREPLVGAQGLDLGQDGLDDELRALVDAHEDPKGRAG